MMHNVMLHNKFRKVKLHQVKLEIRSVMIIISIHRYDLLYLYYIYTVYTILFHLMNKMLINIFHVIDV